MELKKVDTQKMQDNLNKIVAMNKIKSIIQDNNLNINRCMDDFYIIGSWDDLSTFVKFYNGLSFELDTYGRLPDDIKGTIEDFKDIDSILKEWGFSDEYGTCDNCLNHVELKPMDKIDYWVKDGSIICGDCIRTDESLTNDYINHLINNPQHANTILNDSHLEAANFKKCICNNNICAFENGLHIGANDKPDEILKNAIAKNPDREFIFDITGVNMFQIDFTLWNRKKELMEA